MKTKRNSGFSMVEVIIALALIVLVTIASLTIAMSSIATRVTLVNRTYAQNFADNVWECFKAAEDTATFLTLVRNATGEELSAVDRDDDSVIDYYEFKSDTHNFKVIVELTTVKTETDPIINRPKIDVSAFSTKNGRDKLIVDFDYTKGAN